VTISRSELKGAFARRGLRTPGRGKISRSLKLAGPTPAKDQAAGSAAYWLWEVPRDWCLRQCERFDVC
jgi:hypothetical protein